MARRSLEALSGRQARSRRMRVTRLRGPSGELLDIAMTAFFESPKSYTGEDCAELHLHGGPAVVERVIESLLEMGLRLAGPGEFTRRAFENGKLSLDEAEGVADLIDAETKAQARQALGQVQGRLGARYRAWRETLVDALAQLEAAVDFPEDDLPADITAGIGRKLKVLSAGLGAALADGDRGRRVREGYRIAILGAPNAGKSSLMNALLGRPAAIVATTPGTTRDVIEAPLLVEGYKVLLADTAGLRRARGSVEAEGVRRATAWADQADLRLWIVDRSSKVVVAPQALRAGDFCVLNKADLQNGKAESSAREAAKALGLEIVATAAANSAVDDLRMALMATVVRDLSGSDFPAATRARHGQALSEALAHVEAARAEVLSPELRAENLRLAARCLERISGRVGVEDVLDRVFASFCIGK